MVTETITDYEVETREVHSEVTYCDSCGRAVEDGAEAVPLVAGPSVGADVDLPQSVPEAMLNAHSRSAGFAGPPSSRPLQTRDYKRALQELIEEYDDAVRNREIHAKIVMEDVCPSCLEELAGGEVTTGTVESGSVDVSGAEQEGEVEQQQQQQQLRADSRARFVSVSMTILAMLVLFAVVVGDVFGLLSTSMVTLGAAGVSGLMVLVTIFAEVGG